MFITSSHSNKLSNSLFKLKSFSINFTKLERDLQSILWLFGSFLFIRINFFLSNYNWHLLKLISMFAIKKLLQFVILQCLGFDKQKTNIRNLGFMLPPLLQKKFDFFGIHLVTFENYNYLMKKVFHKLTFVNNLFKSTIVVLNNCLPCKANFSFCHWM